MSDRLRFLRALEEAGRAGLHSHDVRRRGISGHPSERARELEAQGVKIRRERENVGRRPGVRFFLEGGVKPGEREPARLFAAPANEPVSNSAPYKSLNPLADSEAA